MFRHLFFFVALVIPGVAQDPRLLTSVKGAVVSDEPLVGNHLTVRLTEMLTRNAVGRAFVASDGSFEFRNVPLGSYLVELMASSGDPIQQQTLMLNSAGDQIEIRLPVRTNKPGGTGTVSVRQLQHPPSAKSAKIFEAAQKASAKGEYLREIEILRGALNDAAAAPYARMNIGVAYIRAGDTASAVPELQEAARLVPENAAVATDLAYALLSTKHVDEAEAECRRALRLDRNNSKARWVMGSILLSKGSHEEEALEDLRLASREIPRARVILAQFYERSGQKDAAAQELREFLPQVSGEERATVERWLSRLSAK